MERPDDGGGSIYGCARPAGGRAAARRWWRSRADSSGLQTVDVPGHVRPVTAHDRSVRLPARPGLRALDLQAAAGPARAPIDARDLRADLRDLQDLPDH